MRARATAWRAVGRAAWRGLVRRPLQTALLFFALTTSLGATLTILAVLAGIGEQMRRDLVRVGMDVVNVHLSPRVGSLFAQPLRAQDCAWMRAVAEGPVAPFRAATVVGVDPASGREAQFLELATTAEWAAVVPPEMIHGRFLEPGETDACALDEWVARALFGDDPAVGRPLVLRAGGRRRELTVVGVLHDPFEIRKRFDELDVTGTARSRLLRMMEFKSAYVTGDFSDPRAAIHGAIVKARDADDTRRVVSELARRFGPRNEYLSIWARRNWVDAVLRAAGLALSVANVLWIVVLLITGVMVTTVSLVAVRERYREIAIRRAEGARRREVALQLLLENALLTLAASAAALVLAQGLAALVEARYLSWRPVFFPGDLALALGMGLVIGALATALPAARAATLDPVRVLRQA